MRLYCFPHAGATSTVYRPWQALAKSRLRVIGVDPPGRGTRAREPKILDSASHVESMAEFVAADLQGAPYMTFGHSYGAMLSLAVAARIGQPPERVVLSAALPPRLQPPVDDLAPLTDEELLDKMARDGGTEPELLKSSGMAGYLVRLMREDYAVRKQFPSDAGLRVDFPLTLVAATDDAYVRPEDMWAWSEHTTAPCQKVELPGDHFAAVRTPQDILSIALGR